MLNLLISDNQELTREGIIAVLSAVDGFKVVGQVANAAELDDMILHYQPDVIVINHFSIDELKGVGARFDFAHMLVLSNNPQKGEVREVTNLGIKNFVSKECSRDELIMAVRSAAKGKQFFCGTILNELGDQQTQNKTIDLISQLSPREVELIHLVAEGLTNKEIAERLFLSIHTVKTHRKNIIKKLGFTFKNAADLISVIGQS